MQKIAKRKISTYLRIDANSINHYFNPHDPARLDKRQLGQEFRYYLDTSVANACRQTHIDFKKFCCETGTILFMTGLLKKINLLTGISPEQKNKTDIQ
jgi:hypothetical protein